MLYIPFHYRWYKITLKNNEKALHEVSRGNTIPWNKQHVFINKRACQTILITYCDRVLIFLDNRNADSERFCEFVKIIDAITLQNIDIGMDTDNIT